MEKISTYDELMDVFLYELKNLIESQPLDKHDTPVSGVREELSLQDQIIEICADLSAPGDAMWERLEPLFALQADKAANSASDGLGETAPIIGQQVDNSDYAIKLRKQGWDAGYAQGVVDENHRQGAERETDAPTSSVDRETETNVRHKS